jgi:hypothetical protein
MTFKKFGILLTMTAKWHHGGLSMRGRLDTLRFIMFLPTEYFLAISKLILSPKQVAKETN